MGVRDLDFMEFSMGDGDYEIWFFPRLNDEKPPEGGENLLKTLFETPF